MSGEEKVTLCDVKDTWIIVSGSRNWTMTKSIENALKDREVPGHTMHLVHGGCFRGADAIAARIAKSRGWKIHVVQAQWKLYGRRAGPLRNASMIEKYGDKAKCILAFSHENSPGTENVIRIVRDGPYSEKLCVFRTKPN